MNGKCTKERIATYRAVSAGRRETSILNTLPTNFPPGVKNVDGVVTVTQATDARPASALGERTEVLGRSKFSIPELKRLP
jgi:hypothetical protein